MEYLDIEIGKSKESGKLIFSRNPNFGKISEIILWIAIIGMFPFISVMNLIRNFENKESLLIPILYLIISVIFGYLFFYSLLSIDKLKRIKGISGSKNRNIITEIGKELNWETQRHNQQITVLTKNWNWSSTNWGRQIVIIYDQKDILINCVTFGKYGIKSPFHWFSGRKIEKELKTKFKYKIKRHTTKSCA